VLQSCDAVYAATTHYKGGSLDVERCYCLQNQCVTAAIEYYVLPYTHHASSTPDTLHYRYMPHCYLLTCTNLNTATNSITTTYRAYVLLCITQQLYPPVQLAAFEMLYSCHWLLLSLLVLQCPPFLCCHCYYYYCYC
jgi:hypothetical protein